MNKVFLVSIFLIIFFAWMDAKQIITFHILDSQQAWTLYTQFTAYAIWVMWLVVLGLIGFIWYIIFKDKSEAIALASSSVILLMFGLEDLFFFLFSKISMPACLDWLGFPQNIISKLMGEVCVSPNALLLNVILGMGIAYVVYNYFKKAKW